MNSQREYDQLKGAIDLFARAMLDVMTELQPWKQERDALLDMTKLLDEHPEGYDGPCMCKLCLSYGD